MLFFIIRILFGLVFDWKTLFITISLYIGIHVYTKLKFKKNKKISLAFLHPYCNAAGGGRNFFLI